MKLGLSPSRLKTSRLAASGAVQRVILPLMPTNALRPRFRILHGDLIALGPGKASLLEAIDRAGTLAEAATSSTADRDGIFSGKRTGTGLDTRLVAGPFEFWAEYLRARFEPDSGVPRRRFDADGWYAQGSYFVVPNRLQIVLKYETFDPNSKADADATDTTTAGANLYLKGHDVKLMADYLRVDAPAPAESQDKFIARLQIIF